MGCDGMPYDECKSEKVDPDTVIVTVLVVFRLQRPMPWDIP